MPVIITLYSIQPGEIFFQPCVVDTNRAWNPSWHKLLGVFTTLVQYSFLMLTRNLGHMGHLCNRECTFLANLHRSLEEVHCDDALADLQQTNIFLVDTFLAVNPPFFIVVNVIAASYHCLLLTLLGACSRHIYWREAYCLCSSRGWLHVILTLPTIRLSLCVIVFVVTCS